MYSTYKQTIYYFIRVYLGVYDEWKCWYYILHNITGNIYVNIFFCFWMDRKRRILQEKGSAKRWTISYHMYISF